MSSKRYRIVVPVVKYVLHASVFFMYADDLMSPSVTLLQKLFLLMEGELSMVIYRDVYNVN